MIKYIDEYRNPELITKAAKRIRAITELLT